MSEEKSALKTLIRDFGLLLHFPAAISVPTFIITIIFKEWIALQAFAIMAAISLAAGQLLYQPFRNAEKSESPNGLILVALSWLVIPLIGAIPFWYIATAMDNPDTTTAVFRTPINALFESMSGFTSTGLSMARDPSKLFYSLQWWRSLSEWIGGFGIIMLGHFILNTQLDEQALYQAETRSWVYHDEIDDTIKSIFWIYFIYTILSITAFYLVGMPLWEAINHGLTGISTGGFSINNQSFTDYKQPVKITAIAIMIMGALSFKIHFLLFRLRNVKKTLKQTQLHYFFLFYIIGLILAFLLNNHAESIDVVFQWTSALATCGFNTTKISLFDPSFLFILIVGMLMAGNADSTTGGLKTERIAWLIKAVSWTIKKTWKNEEDANINYNGEQVDQKDVIEKIRKILVIFFLWMMALSVGTFLLTILVEDQYSFHEILFETSSALNSVGLSTGITGPELHWAGKSTLIVLMWMGRLEIFAVIMLISIPFLLITRKKN